MILHRYCWLIPDSSKIHVYIAKFLKTSLDIKSQVLANCEKLLCETTKLFIVLTFTGLKMSKLNDHAMRRRECVEIRVKPVARQACPLESTSAGLIDLAISLHETVSIKVI